MSRYRASLFILTVLVFAGSSCTPKTEQIITDPPEVVAIDASITQASLQSNGAASTMRSNASSSLDRTEITVFAEDTSITDGDDHRVVVVEGNDTLLTVSGGSIQELIVKDTCQITVHDGIIKGIFIYDQCRVLISGGCIGTISGYGKNTITIREEAKIEMLHSYGATQVIVDSNNASIDTIQYFTKCGCVDQSQRVKLELASGRFDSIGTGSTEVALSITGYNLKKSAYGGDYGYGVVQGRWKNGTDFSINLLDESTFSHTDLHHLSFKGK